MQERSSLDQPKRWSARGGGFGTEERMRAPWPDSWFRSLVEQSLVGTYVIQDVRFLYVNPRLAELFGYTADEVVSTRTVIDLVAPEHRARVLENLRKRLGGEVASICYHFEGIRKDGLRIDVEAHGSRSELEGEPVVIGLLLDVTEQRRAEEERVRLLREAQRALRARDEVLAVVSHDLRNPLNAIVMTTDLLLMQQMEEKVCEMLRRVKRLTGRMEILIRDLLDVSSVEAGRLSVVTHPEAVGPILDAVEEMLGPQAEERGVSLEVRRTDAAVEAVVEADYDRIVQVLSNLVGNALKFTPEGGQVILAAEAESGAVYFTVEDNGCGIPKEHQELLFEPFWRGEQGDGAGLGLAIARGIVTAHGGDIALESEVGKGTRVGFRLARPLAAATPGA